ncbi:hypothetical protein EJB05_02471, partial [Eragrostis curvula]
MLPSPNAFQPSPRSAARCTIYSISILPTYGKQTCSGFDYGAQPSRSSSCCPSLNCIKTGEPANVDAYSTDAGGNLAVGCHLKSLLQLYFPMAAMTTRNMSKPVSPAYVFTALIVFLVILLSRVINNEALPVTSCRNVSTYRANSTFEAHLLKLLLTIPDNTSSAPGKYVKEVIGAKGADQIFALSLCRGDSPTTECSDCLKSVLPTLQQECRYKKEAFFVYEFCLFLYSNRNFLGSVRNTDMIVLSEVVPKLDIKNKKVLSSFKVNLELLLSATTRLVLDNATKVHWFFTSQLIRSRDQSIYALMQCTPDLSAIDCQRCLQNLTQIGEKLYPNGAVIGDRCLIWFDVQPFYIGAAMKVFELVKPPQHEPSHRGGRRRNIIIISVLIVTALVLLLVMFLAFWFCRKKQYGGRSDPIEANEDVENSSYKSYSYKVLKVATQNFAHVNELGRGGFGTVYKGTMNDGIEVAVKQVRDVKTSLEELHREIQFLATLRHQNLVRFIGYCFRKKSRLFVYEYLPNGDLERFRTRGFHQNSRHQQHEWYILLKIIKGVASGLLYLHDNSIVHMDIKPSNIFLDTDFTAKIGDYDLLRKLDPQQTHQTTKNRRGTRFTSCAELEHEISRLSFPSTRPSLSKREGRRKASGALLHGEGNARAAVPSRGSARDGFRNAASMELAARRLGGQSSRRWRGGYGNR